MTAEPVAVWDVSDKTSVYWQNPDRCYAWVKAFIGDSAAQYPYRIEFYDDAGPLARVFAYHTDSEGRRHAAWACKEHPAPQNEACKIPPADVELGQLPPAELLAAA